MRQATIKIKSDNAEGWCVINREWFDDKIHELYVESSNASRVPEPAAVVVTAEAAEEDSNPRRRRNVPGAS